MKPSKYQTAIYEEFPNLENNLLIEAVAGSGKTTTIVEAARLVPRDKSAIFLAFNKKIQEELDERLPPQVQARTFHSIGNEACREKLGWVKINDKKSKNILKNDLLSGATEGLSKEIYREHQTAICKMVSLLKSEALETEEDVEQAIPELAMKHQIDLPSSTIKNLVIRLFFSTINCFEKGERGKVMDFDDMLFLPFYHNMPLEKYDYIFVDEAQDLNRLEHILVTMMCEPSTRIIAVGDSSQAIYGFKGAMNNSMGILKSRFNMKPLPLSISYRCPKNVIELAQRFVSNIEARLDAPEGLVESLQEHMLENLLSPGDLVVCRTTKPLVITGLDLMQKGFPVKILGMDIKKSLLALFEKLDKNKGISLESLDKHFLKVQTHLIQKKKEYQLRVFEENIRIAEGVLGKIPTEQWTIEGIKTHFGILFADKSSSQVITFSTIHKAKGLEAARVFLLRPDLLPHPMATQPWEQVQERNLEYVAITRAKADLYYVYG
tara:strand:- start:37 stop:1515 length:1479 start_codon:yes stop_codon:yes gene_type:complete